MIAKNVSWVFVCQAGAIEREACVLAASLRRSLGEAANLVAAEPTPREYFGEVSSDVRTFLDRLGVRRMEFINPLMHEDERPANAISDRLEDRASTDRADEVDPRLLMNKAFALGAAFDTPVVVFLDSDQLCFAAIDYTDLSVSMVGRRVFYPGAIATDGLWERAYELCRAAMPRQRLLVRSRDPTQSPVITPPYFNSGLISVHRPWLHELVHHYVECYRTLAAHNLLGYHRYYEEQMSLAIAVAKTGVPYEIDNHRLDRSLFHYYSLNRLQSFPHHAAAVASLANDFPGLHELLAPHDVWKHLLRSGG